MEYVSVKVDRQELEKPLGLKTFKSSLAIVDLSLAAGLSKGPAYDSKECCIRA